MNATTEVNSSYSTFTLEMLSTSKFQRLIPSIVYVLILLVVGTPGNIMVLYVYYKRWRKSSTRVFILALAMVDLTNCLFSLPMELSNMFLYLQFDYGWICKLSRFLTYYCNTIGALVLVAIAVDRYQRICKPYKNNMSTKTARRICIIVSIISALSTWPALIIYGTQHIPLSRTISAKMCLIENDYVKTPYPLAYFLFMTIATFMIFFTLSVLYTLVGTKVCRRKKFTHTSSTRGNESVVPDEYEEDKVFSQMLENKNENTLQYENGNASNNGSGTFKLAFIHAASSLKRTKDNFFDRRIRRIGKTTFMLSIVTLVYVLSFIPFLGIVIHRSIFPEHFTNLNEGGEMAFQLFLRSYLLNCAVNPIIYSFCSDIFRKECCINLFLQVVPLNRESR